MSLKDYFGKVQDIKAIANKSSQELGKNIESAAALKQQVKKNERYIPRVDLGKPQNFARYGSAEEYYIRALERIYGTYPYDGSLKERLQWENASSYVDLHIFDNLYPRTNGYIIFSADGWGTSTMGDTYGSSSLPEYIYLQGGPHVNPNGMSPYSTKFTGSNYFDSDLNRESNLRCDFGSEKGVTIEFWMKKREFLPTLTEKEVIFDLWNGVAGEATPGYGRLTLELSASGPGDSGADPWLLTVGSRSAGGTMYGKTRQSIAASDVTTASVADNRWHHYAVSLVSGSTGDNGIKVRFYIDGEMNRESILTTNGFKYGTFNITGALQARIGGLIAPARGAGSSVASAGKLSASIDEFRYWKTRRTSEQVGLNWFAPVYGGTNDDPESNVETVEKVNTTLGVYYKFNEGITNTASTDSVVLDYSGRVTNGAWTGYTSNSRNTGSAIVLSNAAPREFKDPIIYPTNPLVSRRRSQLIFTGSNHDYNNNASFYNSMPGWIIEEDDTTGQNVKKLTQIMASYLDTLQIQIDSLNELKDIQYPSGSQKPLPFARTLVEQAGMLAPELFIDADVLEKLASRSEDKLFEKDLTDLKNIIYQNIYNNLNYIYKSKGTQKSFRNLIRCFGIGEELIQINMYANNVEYGLDTSRKTISVAKKYVNFNTTKNRGAVVYNYSSSLNSNSVNYINSASVLANGYAQTLEAEVIFPLKPDQMDEYYFNTNAISSSLFGIHGALDSVQTTFPSNDRVACNIYSIRDELESPNAQFRLEMPAVSVVLTSSVYNELYNNTRWNFAVKIKPENYPWENQVAGAATSNYKVEFQGVQAEGDIVVNEFLVSASVASAPDGFVTGSKRVYVGAHRTDITGALLQTSDVKVSSVRYWLDYLEPEVIRAHAYDVENFGSLQPHFYAFPFDFDATYDEVPRMDTLALNWDFSQNTGSNATGQFSVADASSGSAALANVPNPISKILNYQLTAKGTRFASGSITAFDKEYMVSAKQQIPAVQSPSDMISVLRTDDVEVFTKDSRPVNYSFAFEKSMAHAISSEMINYFGTIKDFNTLIGAPVNRYRTEYKDLKYVRRKFFEKVANSYLDFEKFYEFYKWFDSSLSVMLAQLVPASADFAPTVRTVIESHMLERNKYQHKLPFLDSQKSSLEAALESNTDYGEAVGSPTDDPQGVGFYSAQAPTRRQRGLSTRSLVKNWNLVHAPPDGSQRKKQLWWRNEAERSISALSSSVAAVNIDRDQLLKSLRQSNNREKLRPYKFSGGGHYILGGVGFAPNKRNNAIYKFTWPDGAVVPGSNIPRNVVLGLSEDIETLIDTTDVYFPSYKQRLGWTMDAGVNKDNKDSSQSKYDVGTIAPFSIYSSSLGDSGVNERVNQKVKAGIEITNLHHDMASADNDIPMQGPFAEKFVGGRQHRHLPLNSYDSSIAKQQSTNYLNNKKTRGEGFKLMLGRCLTATKGALGIVGPQYPDPGSPHYSQSVSTTTSGQAQCTKQVRLGGGAYLDTAGYAINSASYADAEVDNFTVSVWVSASSETINLAPSSYSDRYIWSLGRDGQPRRTLRMKPAPGNRLIYTSTYSGTDLTWYLDTALTASKYSSSSLGGGPGWYNIVIADDSSTNWPRVYINGVSASYLAGTSSAKATGTPSSVQTWGSFGNLYENSSGWPYSNNTWYSGSFGEAALWAKQLTPAQIATLIQHQASSTRSRQELPEVDYIESKTERVILRTTSSYKGVVNLTSSDLSDLNDVAGWWKFGDGTGDTLSTIRDYGSQAQSLTYSEQDPPTKGSMFALSASSLALVKGGQAFTKSVTDSTYPVPHGTLFTRPKANMFRTEVAKRPLNIKNILMTGAAPGVRLSGTLVHNSIGTYQKNYQIVQTSARSINDPFFNDQSFNFALYPETMATRGRAPLTPASSDRKSLQFDGSDDCVKAGNASTWSSAIGGAGNAAKPFSFSAWIYAETGGDSYPRVISVGSTGTDQGDRRLFLDGITSPYPLTLRIKCSSGQVWGTTTTYMAAGAWHHVVGTFDGGSDHGGTKTVAVYLNGVDVTTSTSTTGTPEDIADSGLFIGQRHDGSFNYKGYMCDAAVWNKALSAAEVSDIYGAGARVDLLKSLPASNLLSWWKMGGDPKDTYNGTIYDQAKFSNGTPTNFPSTAIANFSPLLRTGFGSATQNVSGNLDYNLPNRTGANSNQTVFVNKFSAPGGYQVQSRGYLDPAHEEKSVYNAMPFRNRGIIDYGLSGSASADPTVANSIVVVDQIDKNRGLNQRLALHCGPFGSDAAYGSVSALTYVTTPSWHKVNRNTLVRTGGRKARKVANFNGTNSYTIVGTATTWDSLIGGATGSAKPFSVSMWVRGEDSPSVPGAVALWNFGTGDRDLYYVQTNGTLVFRMEGVSMGVVSSSLGALPDNTWKNIVCTFKGGNPSGCHTEKYMKIYVNGELVSIGNPYRELNSASAIAGDSGSLGLFDIPSANLYPFDGQMSDVAVWDRELEPIEVKGIYNKGEIAKLTDPDLFTSPGGKSLSNNLIAYYRFDHAGDSSTYVLNQISTAATNGTSSNVTMLTSSLSESYNDRQYDNWFIQHPIPRSTRQYSWIDASATASILAPPVSGIPGVPLYGYQMATGTVLPSLPTIPNSPDKVTDERVPINFASYAFDEDSHRNVDLSNHLLESPTFVKNQLALHVTGAHSSSATSAQYYYYAGGPGIWAPHIGGSGADAKPMSISFWVNVDRAGSPSGYLDYDRIFEWQQPQNYGSRRRIIVDRRNSTRFELKWQIDSTLGSSRDGKAWASKDENGDDLTYGEWYHIVCTFAGGNGDGTGGTTDSLIKMYVNGTYAGGTGAWPADSGSCNTNSGGGTYSDLLSPADLDGRLIMCNGQVNGTPGVLDRPFNGFIDEAMIWSAELDLAQVSDLYSRRGVNLFNYGPYKNGDLLSWWRMGSTSGDTVTRIKDVENFAPMVYRGPTTALSSVSLTTDYPNYSKHTAITFNEANLNLNGPYQYPSWKQIRTGEHKVARKLREKNKISVALPPPKQKVVGENGETIGLVPALKPIKFVDYVEQPLSSRYRPVVFITEDNTANPNPANNNLVHVSYANNLDFWSNEGLNNRTDVVGRKQLREGQPYTSIQNYVKSTSFDILARYTERIYPREINVYANRTRRRDNYSITGSWNANRRLRTVSASNSQGFFDTAARVGGVTYLEYAVDPSPWPLDSAYMMTNTTLPNNVIIPKLQAPYPTTGSGAGELQNTYCRFGLTASAGTPNSIAHNVPHAAAAYIMPFRGGKRNLYPTYVTASKTPGYVLQGFTPWIAGHQADLDPYQPYREWSNNISLVGKDHTIVPEYRISQLLPQYFNEQGGDFLSPVTDMFGIYGSTLSSSSQPKFYKTYSNSDFMKYMKVIDEDLFGQTNAAGRKFERKKIILNCSALMQFLPYKGFYPAERTVQLTSLFSQSMGKVLTDYPPGAMNRVLLEPLFAPGILHNTIKSGIAVSHFALCNTSSAPGKNPVYKEASGDDGEGSGNAINRYFVYNYYGGTQLTGAGGIPQLYGAYIGNQVSPYTSPFMNLNIVGSASVTALTGSDETNGYYMHRVPFEAIRRPENYLSTKVIKTGYLYDTGYASSSLVGRIRGSSELTNQRQASLKYFGEPSSPLYTLGIDNFLCETVDFFQTPLKHYMSREEGGFKEVHSGSYYTMRVRLARPTDPSVTGSKNDGFGMYSNATAFGAPLLHSGTVNNVQQSYTTFDHVTPPYYHGSAYANIIFKAPYNGRPTLADVFANTVTEYYRDSDAGRHGLNPHRNQIFKPNPKRARNSIMMQLSESVNLFDKVEIVPEGTSEQTNRWLIQTKFETPVLNFWGVATGSNPLPTGSNGPVNVTSSTAAFAIRGMWHQLGTRCKDNEGVSLRIEDTETLLSSSTYGGSISAKSLSSLVGFEQTGEKKIGTLKEAKRVHEAIVAIPFVVKEKRRDFFSLEPDSDQAQKQESLLRKYVFPPTFDYIINSSVSPVAFYAFEFEYTFTQDDLLNIWQNLPPTSLFNKFKKKTSRVEIEGSVLDRLFGQEGEAAAEVQWMMFKVKQRAKKDYNIYTKAGLSNEPVLVEPAIESPYSYNWPYDYFSFVELVKVDESIEYATVAPTSDALPAPFVAEEGIGMSTDTQHELSDLGLSSDAIAELASTTSEEE